MDGIAILVVLFLLLLILPAASSSAIAFYRLLKVVWSNIYL